MSIIGAIGEKTLAGFDNATAAISFVGETMSSAFYFIFHPRRFRYADWALAFQRAALDGLPVTTGIGVLLGVILAFESAAALRMFGVEVYVADLLTVGLFRELGPLITAIVLAGRSGSAFAAEIGTMKVDEELDALTTMGLKPVRFLVMPRVLATTLAMPILTIFAELAGLIGGAVVLSMMNVPTPVFWSHAIDTCNIFMITFGLAKGALFGFLVGMVACSAGIRTKSTPDGVGVAATKAVVGGMVTIAVADGIIAFICSLWGI